jgi:NADPH-dependent 2,4-dienoyl-CoA reductase/sulfur reductase-like enzyme
MSLVKQQVVVVGGGPAGCAAALEAARLGLQVTLVDEHPQPLSAMSLDAPYFYGTRLVAELSDASAIAERVLSANEALMECLEAGVDVLTGTCVWGLFVPGENLEHLGGQQVGLADETRSWMLGFDYLILAPGARDLVLSFSGWQMPGVLAVKAASALLTQYHALGGRDLLILGSGNVALSFAQQASQAGLNVKGIVEPAPQVQGDDALAASLRASGVPFHTGFTIAGALGDREVTGAQLVPVGPEAAEEVTIACDTICMAMGVVPNIELASVAGCGVRFDETQGGWIPELTENMESTAAGIFVVGDGAGVSDASPLSSASAIAQGVRAARAIAKREGLIEVVPGEEGPAAQTTAARQAKFPPMYWLESLVARGGMDVQLCQCEEVTRREFLAVEPPRYLAVPEWRPKGLSAVTNPSAEINQDFLKRMTRVGMGHCQGKRCREHSSMLVAKAAGVSFSSVRPGSYRIPVRALSLQVLFAEPTTPETEFKWSAWSWMHDDPERMKKLGLQK